MKKLILFLILVSQTAMAVDLKSEEEFDKAFESGDAKTVALFFKDQGKFPFNLDNRMSDGPGHYLSIAINRDQVEIVKMILEYSSSSVKNRGLAQAVSRNTLECREDIIQVHLDSDADLSCEMIKVASETLCLKTVKILLSAKSDCSKQALSAFGEAMINRTEQRSSDFFKSEDQRKIAKELGEYLKSVNKSEVVKNFADTEQKYQAKIAAVDAEIAITKEENRVIAAEAEKDAKYRGTPEFIHDEACGAHNAIKFSEEAIRQEHDQAKHTGVINTKTLHDWGIRLNGSKQIFESKKAEYKKRTGKNINLSNCKEADSE